MKMETPTSSIITKMTQTTIIQVSVPAPPRIGDAVKLSSKSPENEI